MLIWLQTRTGYFEAEEVEVLLVELWLPYVDGEADVVELPQVVAVFNLISQIDQNVVQINKNKIKPFHYFVH